MIILILISILVINVSHYVPGLWSLLREKQKKEEEYSDKWFYKREGKKEIEKKKNKVFLADWIHW